MEASAMLDGRQNAAMYGSETGSWKAGWWIARLFGSNKGGRLTLGSDGGRDTKQVRVVERQEPNQDDTQIKAIPKIIRV